MVAGNEERIKIKRVKWLNKKIPAAAIAIVAGLGMAYIGGILSGGKNGIADIEIFSGFGILGGTMFRDFSNVSIAMGADFKEIKKTGAAGIVSLIVFLSFLEGPITGGAIGASSDVI